MQATLFLFLRIKAYIKVNFVTKLTHEIRLPYPNFSCNKPSAAGAGLQSVIDWLVGWRPRRPSQYEPHYAHLSVLTL